MFQENSFLISISFTLLLAGIIIYYVNNRFKIIEGSINRQSNILSDFITNVRNDLGGNSLNVDNENKEFLMSGPPSKDATIEAKVSAERYLSEKIEVSDSDSDSDSVTDSDSDSDEDVPININNTLDNVKVIEVKKESNENDEDFSHLEEVDLNPKKIMESNDLNNLTSELKAVKLDNPTSDDVTKSNVEFKKMKVDDLRKLALSKNLSKSTEINKMKKVELVSLLETNKSNLNDNNTNQPINVIEQLNVVEEPLQVSEVSATQPVEPEKSAVSEQANELEVLIMN